MNKLTEKLPTLLLPAFLALGTGVLADQENPEEAPQELLQETEVELTANLMEELQEGALEEDSDIEDDAPVVEPVTDAGLFPEDPSTTRVRIYYENDNGTSKKMDIGVRHLVQWGVENKGGHTEIVALAESKRKKVEGVVTKDKQKLAFNVTRFFRDKQFAFVTTEFSANKPEGIELQQDFQVGLGIHADLDQWGEYRLSSGPSYHATTGTQGNDNNRDVLLNISGDVQIPVMGKAFLFASGKAGHSTRENSLVERNIGGGFRVPYGDASLVFSREQTLQNAQSDKTNFKITFEMNF